MAWFGDRLATGLVEVRHDAAALDEPGWWAVVIAFDGRLVAGRFEHRGPAPTPSAWTPLDGPWRSSLDRTSYQAGVRELRSRIGAGDVYQVNLCRVLEHDLPAGADLLGLAARTSAGNPAPHQGFVRLPGAEVVCASPELFLRRDGDRVVTGPIKGTAATADLLLPKDVDENVMIVDLSRNDLSPVSRTGTVVVDALLDVEHHPGLVHLVSRVSGLLLPGTTWADLLGATLPPASVTGAPKSTALRAIADLEPVGRGPYCGAVGWVDNLHEHRTAELAVTIRSFWRAVCGDGRPLVRFGTGAGITWGSDPAGEWQETELKARRLVGLAGGAQ